MIPEPNDASKNKQQTNPAIFQSIFKGVISAARFLSATSSTPATPPPAPLQETLEPKSDYPSFPSPTPSSLNTDIFHQINALQPPANPSSIQLKSKDLPDYNNPVTMQFEQKRILEAKELSDFIKAIEQKIPGDQALHLSKKSR